MKLIIRTKSFIVVSSEFAKLLNFIIQLDNHITLNNGKKINVDKLNFYYPFTMLINEFLVLNIAEIVAEKIYAFERNSLEFKVAVNFLSQRSMKIKKITAIILLSQTNKIKEINVEYFSQHFTSMINYEINIINKPDIRKFIDPKVLVSLFVKIIPNKLYLIFFKLFFSNQKNKKSVVRAWVDVDEYLHKDVINSSTLFIYPFGINIKRGLRFIRSCYRKYSSVTLIGIPYSFKKLFGTTLKYFKNSDENIILFEIDGMEKHSQILREFSSIHTSDEYTPAVYALYDKLKGISIITNNCHGIGFYNRYINYDLMQVFNQKQKEYYTERNQDIKYEVKYIEDEENLIVSKKINNYYIIIDQGDLEKHSYHYESSLQNELYFQINNLAKSNVRKFFIKFHPNRSEKSINRFQKKYSFIVPLKKIEEIKDVPIIFINLYSTAYFDFKSRGNFIFIHDNLFNPKKIFGNHIQSLEINQLVSKLKSEFK